jgi:L-serine dehydratase
LGHGTDLAVVGGLLNYDTDDLRIAQAMEHASSLGLEIEFKRGTGPIPHPNTAKIRCTSSRQTIEILGMSIGGGNIEISEVDGFGVKFTAVYFTLVIWHTDRQGFIADATGLLNRENVNIGYMDTCRKARNGEAMTVIEADNPCSPALLYQLSKLPGVLDVKSVNLLERSEPLSP